MKIGKNSDFKLYKVVWSGIENTAAENNAYFQFFGNHKFLKRQNKNCKTIFSDVFLRITELSSTILCFKKENFGNVILSTLNLRRNSRPVTYCAHWSVFEQFLNFYVTHMLFFNYYGH